MDKKKWIGVLVFVVLILIIIGIKAFGGSGTIGNLTTIYVATGGGKEDFLSDERVQEILTKCRI